jgi:PAS domain-containing protein
MMVNKVPTDFLALMPVPIVVTTPQFGYTNSSIVFINQRFTDELGWQISDIPDKNTWWQKAYPDLDYQKVVERQWELVISNAKENGEKSVSLEVNITTKFQDIKRYRITSFLHETICVGYNIIVFTRLPTN